MGSIRQIVFQVGALGLIAICVAGGCSRPDPDQLVVSGRQGGADAGAFMTGGSPQRAWDMVAQARKRVQSLTVEEVARELADGAVILDLRESEERLAHGAIPGAVHAPRGMLEFWADPTSPVHRPEFDPSHRYVLHCAVGGRSALAAATLQDMGYTNVVQLDGGFAAWREAGKPVESITELSDNIVTNTGVRGDQ